MPQHGGCRPLLVRAEILGCQGPERSEAFRLYFPDKKITKNRDKFFLDGHSTRKPFSRVLEALAVCLVCYRASKKGPF
jgi:hypothetical protein